MCTASTTTRRCSRRPASAVRRRRCRELTAYAKKLTKRNGTADQGRRLRPVLGFYAGTLRHDPLSRHVRRQVDRLTGKSSLRRTRPGRRCCKWQKSLVDWYGYEKLQKFTRRSRPTSSRPRNAFEIGKLAMILDGEWRVAFVQANVSEPDYGTAPAPVDDAIRSSTARVRQRHDHGHPEERQARGQAWALLEVTSRPTAMRSRCSRTGSATCPPRRRH